MRFELFSIWRYITMKVLGGSSDYECDLQLHRLSYMLMSPVGHTFVYKGVQKCQNELLTMKSN